MSSGTEAPSRSQSNQSEGSAPSPRIKSLAALLVNQIAAGEVVERPASIVKELLDNALDAGAMRIVVEIEAGGVDLLRVTDDGVGIAPEDLALALAPHATSKIAESQDLDRIGTFGFRGEALASIASVSRLSIRSRQPDNESAYMIEAAGEVVSERRPESGPIGTCVTVRDLFFNTPARRKFLRTSQTEQGHCLETARTLAMAHSHVGFTVRIDGRERLNLPAGQSPKQRVVAIVGEELAPRLIEVHADEFDDARGLALWGLAGLPELARPTLKGQHVFVNGRPIRDRTIQHAIQEAYRGLIEPSRKPTAVLMLEMAPAAVDVNVHPAKAEVRFRDSGLVHSVVHRAVREALLRADLTPKWPGQDRGGFREFGSDRPPESAGQSGSVSASAFADSFTQAVGGPDARIDYDALRGEMDSRRSEYLQQSTPIPIARPADRVLQVHKSYLITQDEQGVVIVDQHALHERVMFEQIMQRLSSGVFESQRLLTPAVVSVPAQRVERLDGLTPLFEKLGIEAAPLGPDTIAIHAFPTFLFDKGVDPAEFLSDLLEQAESDGFPSSSEEALHEIVDMMACKAAVKAGDWLTEQELAELVAMRSQYERASNCPHGRPTTIRLSIRDLERQFGRT